MKPLHKVKKHKRQKLKPNMGEPVIHSRLSRALDLSGDVLSGAALLYGEGNRKICIENYRSLIEYTDERIRIQTKTCQICIEGKHLMVAYFRDDEMCVVGYLQNIQYTRCVNEFGS